MQITSEQISKIDYVIANFNFEKVHLTMTTLDWVWNNENNQLKVPSIAELKATASYLLLQTLKNTSKQEYTCSSGGIVATRELETDQTPEIFQLHFILTSCDSEFYQ